MLTFFRRIRQSLIRSDQTRKYILYAIGEVLLVMIGILLALQVNNWNEWRKDRVIEKEALIDIVFDIERNINFLERVIEQLELENKSCDIILNVIENKLPYKDSLNYHFWKSRFVFGRSNQMASSGFESLKDNGINLIVNKSVRDEILNLFESTYSFLKMFDTLFAQYNPLAEEVILELFYQEGQSEIPFQHEQLFTNNRYYALLKSLRQKRIGISDISRTSLTESERVLQLIKEELGETRAE